MKKLSVIIILALMLLGVATGIIYDSQTEAVSAFKQNLLNNEKINSNISSTIKIESDKVCIIENVEIIDGKEEIKENCLIQYSYVINDDEIRKIIILPSTTTKEEDVESIKAEVKNELKTKLSDPTTYYKKYNSQGEKLKV